MFVILFSQMRKSSISVILILLSFTLANKVGDWAKCLRSYVNRPSGQLRSVSMQIFFAIPRSLAQKFRRCNVFTSESSERKNPLIIIAIIGRRRSVIWNKATEARPRRQSELLRKIYSLWVSSLRIFLRSRFSVLQGKTEKCVKHFNFTISSFFLILLPFLCCWFFESDSLILMLAWWDCRKCDAVHERGAIEKFPAVGKKVFEFLEQPKFLETNTSGFYLLFQSPILKVSE